jgi:hypothetical protein
MVRAVWAYGRVVHRCDEALLRSVYHDDGYDDHGLLPRPGGGVRARRAQWRPGAGWRIAIRTVVPEWQTAHRGQFIGLPAGTATASRDRTDVSYGNTSG